MNLLTIPRHRVAGGTALAALLCHMPTFFEDVPSAATSPFADYSRIEKSILQATWISATTRLPLALEFQQLVAEWKLATRFESSPTRMASYPSYQRIMGMGEKAVPFLLRELSGEPDFWFDALSAITGEQPVSAEHAGHVADMAEDWLQWGRQHGYEC